MNRLVVASASVGCTNTLFSLHSTLNVGLPAATCTTGSPTSMTVRWFNAVFRCTMRVRSLVWVSIFCATAGISTAASTANINTTRLMACLFLSLVRMLYVQETPSEVSWTVVVSWVQAAARHFLWEAAAAVGYRERSLSHCELRCVPP